jgi:hypothetical protein
MLLDYIKNESNYELYHCKVNIENRKAWSEVLLKFDITDELDEILINNKYEVRRSEDENFVVVKLFDTEICDFLDFYLMNEKSVDIELYERMKKEFDVIKKFVKKKRK